MYYITNIENEESSILNILQVPNFCANGKIYSPECRFRGRDGDRDE